MIGPSPTSFAPSWRLLTQRHCLQPATPVAGQERDPQTVAIIILESVPDRWALFLASDFGQFIIAIF
jgi:hypothetical protein